MVTSRVGLESVWVEGQIVSSRLSSGGRTCRQGKNGLHQERELSGLSLASVNQPIYRAVTYQGELILLACLQDQVSEWVET